MSKSSARLLVAVLSVSLLSGCWDQVQIEERGFVVGVGIDLPSSKEMERQTEKEAPDKPKGKRRYLVTHQFVVPGGLVSNSQGGGGSQSSTGDPFQNLTSEGDSLFEISRELAVRTSRSPFYQHLKVVIVSEEVAKSPNTFADVLDYFLRDPDLRRTSKVMISKGKAKPVLEVKPKTEKLPSLYINSVAENTDRTARMIPEVRLGEVHEDMINEFSFVLPRIVAANNEVKVAGAAVFQGQGNKMIGFLGEEETEGLNFLLGNVQGGLLKTKVKDNLVIFNIQGTKRTIKADVRDKKRMRFQFFIECEGVIAESFERLDFMESRIMDNLQKTIAAEIERLSHDAIRKVQKKMKTDVLGLGTYVKQTHPDLWKQLKEDWDHGRNLFASSEIEVKAVVYIRNGGSMNRTEIR
ncbi:Ger(x)C family spore germination protein [Brevibacillus borstelensis]|uniref:Ger(x)C family spore germination protein n=1 Tax=Brevibacillus borstelensis TaxID=45462 RepID=UPI0014900A58|nr:Ger(x)C family spore germination protein [Brevibacillus borstelensis]MED1872919.1 Ger(x)C family spore germination protein [Brevibacillus borstelensis]NOU54287.1 Ger(x)C family spore germination protein [Brevibacillus borstelensis]WNF07053.1 Ger(x)C family spore germination protein [Brevibacillus borstelensis]